MRTLHAPTGLVRLLLVLAAACTREQQAEPGARAPDSAAAPTVAAAADTGCRKEGLWATCSVEDRLKAAGLVIAPQAEPAAYPFFGVPGISYKVGAGDDEVQVFLYASEAARRADTDRLDSATVSPKGERRSYPVPPLLVTSNNLAALVFTLNDRTSERLSLALSAGLPQPRP